MRRASDLLRPALGWEALAARPAALAEYYRGGLRFDVEPGTKWAYSNHGFATLGQIVEDVSGLPFDRYLRARVFGPLGMESTDLVRSERVRARLATGYELRSGGLEAVAEREIATAGASGVYSTTSDMARYVAALLGGGSTSTAQCSDPRRSLGCSSPTTSPIRESRAWGWGSFATRSAATGPSATTGAHGPHADVSTSGPAFGTRDRGSPVRWRRAPRRSPATLGACSPRRPFRSTPATRGRVRASRPLSAR